MSKTIISVFKLVLDSSLNYLTLVYYIRPKIIVIVKDGIHCLSKMPQDNCLRVLRLLFGIRIVLLVLIKSSCKVPCGVVGGCWQLVENKVMIMSDPKALKLRKKEK